MSEFLDVSEHRAQQENLVAFHTGQMLAAREAQDATAFGNAAFARDEIKSHLKTVEITEQQLENAEAVRQATGQLEPALGASVFARMATNEEFSIVLN